jgi:hypothetical protein
MVRQKTKPVNRLLVATQYRYRFSVAAALCIVLIVFVSPSSGVEEVVDADLAATRGNFAADVIVMTLPHV